jgi:hypothetical protein
MRPGHDLVDLRLSEFGLFGHVDEPFDIAAKGYLFDPLHRRMTNVYILLCINQLPARPRDHRRVVHAIPGLRVGARHVVLASEVCAKPPQFLVARDAP